MVFSKERYQHWAINFDSNLLTVPMQPILNWDYRAALYRCTCCALHNHIWQLYLALHLGVCATLKIHIPWAPFLDSLVQQV